MAIFLGIETSGYFTEIAFINEKKEELLTIGADTKAKHEEHIYQFFDWAFNYLKVSVSELEGIGVSIGPGMFTSLRVGLSIAKGFALPFNIPIKGINTLDALAKTYYSFHPEEEREILPVIDAKKESVYYAIYHKKNRLTDYLIACPKKLGLEHKNAVFLGNGLLAYPEIFSPCLRASIFYPKAAVIAVEAQKKIKEGLFDDLSDLSPFYIRKPDALSKTNT